MRNNETKKEEHKKRKAIIILLLLLLFIFIFYFIDYLSNKSNNQITKTINIDSNKFDISLNGDVEEYIEFGDTYEEFGANASYDGQSLSDKIEIDKSKLDLTKPGRYIVTYRIEKDGVVKEIHRIINVVQSEEKVVETEKITEIENVVIIKDTQKPVITLKGSSEITLKLGEKYIEQGVSVTDNSDTEISKRVIISGAVDIEKVGVYYITYSVTDSSGNKSITQRKIIVIDKIAPVITLTGNETIYLEAKSDIYVEQGAIVTDNYDNSVQASLSIIGNVNPNVKGTYIVTYTAVDASGNTATKTRTIIVQDRTRPTVIVVPTQITLALNSSWNPLNGVSADDNYDGNRTSSVTYTGTLVLSEVGEYTLSYTVTDSSGNISNVVTRKVNVTANTPPQISLDFSNVYKAEVFSAVPTIIATAIDKDNQEVADITIDYSSINMNVIGIYEAVITAVDQFGVSAATSVNIEVVHTTKPVISLVNENEEVTIEVGSVYTESGYTATSNYYGNITSSVNIAGTLNVNEVGQYTLTYSVTDASGNISILKTRTIIVQDTTIPTVTVVPNEITVTVNSTLNILDGVSATDNYDGNITSSVTYTGTLDLSTVGEYTISYKVLDASGNESSTVTRKVNVIANTPPEITLNASNIYTKEVFTSTPVIIATAVDKVGQAVTNVTINYSNINMNVIGTYAVIITAVDQFGISATMSVNIEVVHTTKPVISLVNENEEVTIEVGSVYTESGYTATSNYYGNITSSVIVSGTLNVNEVGQYTLTYSVTDASGNISILKTRIINVIEAAIIDTTAPVITLTGNETIYLEAKADTYVEQGAIVTDNYDNTVQSSLNITGNVNPNLKGTYTITYTATDISGNTATKTRTIIVQDTIIPTVTVVPNEITVTVNSTLNLLDGVSATDNYDGNITANITYAGILDLATVGEYTISYKVLDSSENESATVTKIINVIANTPPQITLNASNIYTKEVFTTAPVIVATAMDRVGQAVTNITINYNNVNMNVIGTYAVIITAVDQFGISATMSVNIEVVHTTKPVISLVNENEEVTIEVGSVYTESGYSATSNYYGNITSSVNIAGTLNVNEVGQYTLTYSVTDASGNISILKTRTIIVQDTVIPTVTVVPNEITVTVNSTLNLLDGVSATDNYDGNITSSVTYTGTLDLSTVGEYTISYKVLDTSGNESSTVTRKVNVIANTPPEITLNASNIYTKEVFTTAPVIIATAVDKVGQAVTNVTINYNNVNMNVIGTYAVIITAVDQFGISATMSVNIEVVHTTKPVIILVNENEEVTIEVGSVYTELGYTATSNYYGNITSSVNIAGTLNVNEVGQYTLTYSVTDASGNISILKTRIINVIEAAIIDTTAPVITLTGNETIYLEAKADTYVEQGAIVTDDYDNTVQSSLNITGNVNPNLKGTYTITYTATDISGNTATKTRTIIVQDTIIPTVTVVPNEITVTVNSTLNILDGVSATDNYDGNITSSVTYTGTLDLSTVGEYTISYKVLDSSENESATVTKIINVIANTPPQITLNASNIYTKEVFTTAPVIVATAMDRVGQAVTNITINYNNVNMNVIGTYAVIITAVDQFGISATMSVNIEVVHTTKPLISLVNESEEVTIQVGSVYTELGYTATSNYYGNITSSVNIAGTLNTNAIGQYTLTYSVTDASGNTSILKTRTINVIETQAPLVGTVAYDTTVSFQSTVTLTVNKEIVTPAGWTKIDAHTYKKVYTANINETLTITDLLSNSTTVNVLVRSIIPTGWVGIYTANQLYSIGNSVDYPINKKYILMNDLDISLASAIQDEKGATALSTTATNWAPITGFSGELDGNWYTIKGLKIDKLSTANIGLFKTTTSTANIMNLTLENVDIKGGQYTGGLVGTATGGKITNVKVTGIVQANNTYVGGLVGYSTSAISNSSSSANVTGTGSVGGLIGWQSGGTVTLSNSTGVVTSTGPQTGGLVGYTSSTTKVTLSYAKGTVKGTDTVGGLIGYLEGGGISQVSKCYASGDITATGTDSGGLIGKVYSQANAVTIDNSYAVGAVAGGTYVGGFIGNEYTPGSNANYKITVSNSYSLGKVTGTTIGGFLGRIQTASSYITNTNCYWIIDTSGLQTSTGLEKGITIAQAVAKNTYVGWDFSTIWSSVDTGTDKSSPYLKDLIIPDQVYLTNLDYYHYEGTGTLVDPILIYTEDDLDNVRNLTAFNFKVMNDIEITSRTNWTPIVGFSGSIDGNGKTIKGLQINRTGTTQQGLFGNTTGTSNIHDLTLENVNITGGTNTGALIGNATGGTVTNVNTSGTINSNGDKTGGLIGSSTNVSVTNNTSSVNITSTTTNVGGLIGWVSGGTISSNSTTGNVKGTDYTGGLVGNVTTAVAITSCTTSGNITGTNNTGGLVGYTIGTITSSKTTGAVTGGTYVGGLVGTSSTSITDSNTEGNVTGTGNYVGGLTGTSTGGTVTGSGTIGIVKGIDYVGGLIGNNTATINTSTATGAVSGRSFIGGLIGQTATGAITSSSAIGNVTSTGTSTGGLIGSVSSATTITSSYATGNVTSTGASTGGLIGSGTAATINTSYATGNVVGITQTGGLIGYTSSTTKVTLSYAKGTVKGTDTVGGLIGYLEGGGISQVSKCYASGDITATGTDSGGLIGKVYSQANAVTIDNSYAVGAVSGGTYVGGFIGNEYTPGSNANYKITVSNSYSLGKVTGTTIGGFLGRIQTASSYITNTNCYWIIDTSGLQTSTGLEKGITIAQAVARNTYVGWDFSTIWSSVDTGTDKSSPYLKDLIIPDQVYLTNLDYYHYEGTGTLVDPILIYTEDDLDNVRNLTAFNFKVMNDIEITSRTNWTPIVGFSGSIDGNGKTIKGLQINRTGTTQQGLFGNTTGTSNIHDLTLENVNITGGTNTGALIGNATGGTVTNVNTSGTINSNGDKTGGLIGSSTNVSVTNNTSSVNITSTTTNVGGLIGWVSGGTISSNSTTGNVKGTDYTGGLVGNVTTAVAITSCTTSGNITGTNNTGGLVGYTIGTITSSKTTGAVTGGTYVGGLVGTSSTSITDSNTEGNVTGTGNYVGGLTGTSTGGTVTGSGTIGIVKGIDYVGGLIGNNTATINTSTATGAVSGRSFIGGLIGQTATGAITSSSAIGNVTSTGTSTGGLIGSVSSATTITSSYATGNVTSTGASTGGLIGSGTAATINTSYATGNVVGITQTGGLIGYTSSTTKVTLSYAKGTVKGTDTVGGLIGYLEGGGISQVSKCYASGDITATGTDSGGLIGRVYSSANAVTIDNSYAVGAVSGGTYVGGFIGNEYTPGSNANYKITVSNSYSLGKVTGTTIGGFLGRIQTASSYITNTNCYWIIDTSGLQTSTGLEKGITIAQAVAKNTYVGWDFSTIWSSVDTGTDKSSPYLKDLIIPDQVYLTNLDYYHYEGTGTLIDPILIYTENDLDNVRNLTAFNFKVMNDIEITSRTNWTPIVGFSGSIDGNGKTIKGLQINRTGTTQQGLFGNTTGTSNIHDLTLENVNITGGTNTGALIGNATGGTVTNVNTSGTINSNGDKTGGLIGSSTNVVITNNTSSVNITSTTTNVGGLIGWVSGGTISSNSTTGNVKGTDYTGGLVGNVTTAVAITSCTTSGNITGTNNTGGLVGYTIGTITSSKTTGAVTGGTYVGGLVGTSSTSITDSNTEGNVTGTGNYVGGLTGTSTGGTVTGSGTIGIVKGIDYVGGLIGNNTATINTSTATGAVSGRSFIGGLIGQTATGAITSSSAIGNVTSTGTSTGGLIGSVSSATTITSSYATGNVTSTGASTGGLIGSGTAATINTSYATGNVVGITQTGGLIGYTSSTTKVTLSYAKGTVKGTDTVGGLIGYLEGGGISQVSKCYASGDITATGTDSGGLIGKVYSQANAVTIDNSYAVGAVSGGTYVGGFIGNEYTPGSNANYKITVSNSYSLGKVTGTTIGGFLGRIQTASSYITNTNCYWIIDTSGLQTSTGLEKGITIAQAVAKNTYVGWDFSTIWSSVDTGTDKSSPYLKDLIIPDQVYLTNLDYYHYEGTGTLIDPILIYTENDLDNVRNLTAFNFKVMNDIEITSRTNWTPIVGFSGSIDGNGKTIKGLQINRTGTTQQGLFGNTTGTSNIHDLTLENVNITGGTNTGALIGNATGGTVTNVNTSGTINSNGDKTGGLIGSSTNVSVTNNTSSVNITSTTTNVGGLIGWVSGGTISPNSTAGNVKGTDYTGGLVGNVTTAVAITSCTTSGNITGTNNTGGLVGYTIGTITSSKTTGAVTGGTYVGGLVGTSSTSITDSNTEGNVTGTGTYIGGLVGNLTGGTVTGSGTIGIVKGIDYVGGLIGNNTATINTSTATGAVSGRSFIGGLIGQTTGTITTSYATGNVTSTGSYTGGLIGYGSSATINSSYATGNVIGTTQTGGLVGYAYSATKITLSHATGTVKGTDSIGGLIGDLYGSGISQITKSYASGDITATGTDIGGFIGRLYSSVNTITIDNSYAVGAVAGGTYVGGFIGNETVPASSNNYKIAVSNSYSLGKVTGTTIGGFLGRIQTASSYITNTNCYWIIDTSEVQTSTRLEKGITIAQAVERNTYVGWDFSTIWSSVDTGTDKSSPYLKDLIIPDQVYITNLDYYHYEGTGTLVDPILIYTEDDLDNVRNLTAFNFKVMNDIEITSRTNWTPIVGFSGSIDGNGKTIKGLQINRTGTTQQGLFGNTTGTSNIHDLTLENVNITGGTNTGALIGNATGGTVTNVNTSGTINSNGDKTGGLIGSSTNVAITNNTSSVNITSTTTNVGGLIGWVSGGTISSNSTTGNVKGTDYTGGLVGNVTTAVAITSCTTSGNITGTNNTGGLVGYTIGTITSSKTTGAVTGGTYVGGLVGTSSTSITDSNTEGNVTGTGTYIGGLVGNLTGGTVTGSGTIGIVKGIDYVGGLIGNNTATINTSTATGAVSGRSFIGGLIGQTTGTITTSYATGNVTSTGSYTGGLIGYGSSATINSSYATGNVIGTTQTGGLVGYAYSATKITLSHATGTVKGTDSIGGLIGDLYGSGISQITKSYASGDITATGTDIGGFIGRLYSSVNTITIDNSYAVGAVAGGTYVGGFIGNETVPASSNNYKIAVSNSYSLGKVTGTTIGGFLGRIQTTSSYITNTNCYWIIDTSEVQTSTVGIGITIAQAVIKTTYNTWDFTGIWSIEDTETDKSSPYLKEIISPDQVYLTNLDYHHYEGTGTLEDPILIYTEDDLNNVRNLTAFNFKVMNDIEITVRTNWAPIVGFSGSIDGNGKTIKGLQINRTGTAEQGLFGNTTGTSNIHDLTLENVEITGGQYTGGLIGNATGGAVTNVHTSGTINSNGIRTGGIIGTSTNVAVTNNTSSVNIVSTTTNVGGLIGWISGGTISSNSTAGNVKGTDYTGGLVGNVTTAVAITSCTTSGIITGANNTGGLVGNTVGTITSSKTTGAVTGGTYVGGLVGTSSMSITDSNTEGNVTGTGTYIGGLVGNLTGGTVTGSGTIGIVKGIDYVGGLIGNNTATINTSTATGAVSGRSFIGGLIGQTTGTITTSYATGNVTSTGSYTGGLIGYGSSATINSSYATGNVIGTTQTGGLVGYAYSATKITLSHATGTVKGTDSIGGLIGDLYGSGISQITKSYASGDITATGTDIGGFIGRLYSSVNTIAIDNSYAVGAVAGGTYVGGFIGNETVPASSNNYKIAVSNSYSLGKVTGTTIGGFLGRIQTASSYVTNTNCYWNTVSSEAATSIAGTGKTTSEMKTQPYTDVYVGWDFANIWSSVSESGYPILIGLTNI